MPCHWRQRWRLLFRITCPQGRGPLRSQGDCVNDTFKFNWPSILTRPQLRGSDSTAGVRNAFLANCPSRPQIGQKAMPPFENIYDTRCTLKKGYTFSSTTGSLIFYPSIEYPLKNTTVKIEFFKHVFGYL